MDMPGRIADYGLNAIRDWEKIMSDAEASVIREARRDWVTEHREKYLRSGGVEGHIEDLTPVNGRTFGTHHLCRLAAAWTRQSISQRRRYLRVDQHVRQSVQCQS